MNASSHQSQGSALSVPVLPACRRNMPRGLCSCLTHAHLRTRVHANNRAHIQTHAKDVSSPAVCSLVALLKITATLPGSAHCPQFFLQMIGDGDAGGDGDGDGDGGGFGDGETDGVGDGDGGGSGDGDSTAAVVLRSVP